MKICAPVFRFADRARATYSRGLADDDTLSRASHSRLRALHIYSPYSAFGLLKLTYVETSRRPTLICSIAALLSTGLLLAVSVLAQDVDPSSPEAMHRRLIGSFRRGRVTAVADDAGMTWSKSTQDPRTWAASTSAASSPTPEILTFSTLPRPRSIVPSMVDTPLPPAWVHPRATISTSAGLIRRIPAVYRLASTRARFSAWMPVARGVPGTTPAA